MRGFLFAYLLHQSLLKTDLLLLNLDLSCIHIDRNAVTYSLLDRVRTPRYAKIRRCVPVPFALVILVPVVGKGERRTWGCDGSCVGAASVTLVRTTVRSTVGFWDSAAIRLTQYFVERTLFTSLCSFSAWVAALGEHLQEVALISHFSQGPSWSISSYSGQCNSGKIWISCTQFTGGQGG